jgi:hypothetical protein
MWYCEYGILYPLYILWAIANECLDNLGRPRSFIRFLVLFKVCFACGVILNSILPKAFLVARISHHCTMTLDSMYKNKINGISLLTCLLANSLRAVVLNSNALNNLVAVLLCMLLLGMIFLLHWWRRRARWSTRDWSNCLKRWPCSTLLKPHNVTMKRGQVLAGTKFPGRWTPLMFVHWSVPP